MVATLNITSTGYSSYYDTALVFNPDNNTQTAANIKAISAITNENTASSRIVETFFPILTTGVSPVIISSIRLDSTLLLLGKKTLVFVRYTFKDNSFLDSNVELLTNNSVAIKPVLSTPQVIRPEDRGLSINIGSLYTLNSESDGFSAIDKVIVIISKVNGTKDNVYTRIVNIDGGYNKWYPIGASDLDNADDYEVSISVVNHVAISEMSNTIVVQPLDTASQMDKPIALSLLSYQKTKNDTLNDTTGDIVVFFNKPLDFEALKNATRPILKYKLYQQEYTDMPGNPVSGTPTLFELTVPDTGLATFELSTPESVDDTNYTYKYIISGNPDKLGKKFKYTITGYNINGDGPISDPTDQYAYSFILPSEQDFSLNHTNTTSNVTATPLNIYDGNMTMTVSSLSNVNGGKANVTPTNTSAVTSGASQNNAYTRNSVTLNLKVFTEGTNPTQIYADDVTFVQDISSAVVITGAVGNQTTTTTYTPQNSYTLDFNSVNTADVTTLNEALDLGTKYRFKLSRQTADPANTGTKFLSSSTDKVRTKFRSPQKISDIQSYAINDDFTPVSGPNEPKLRLVFKQLTVAQLNGMASFNSQIEYKAYQQSLPVDDLDSILHDNDITTDREFTINQSSFGGSSTNYIRVKAFNTELNKFIDAIESTPAVVESAVTFVTNVSNLQIIKNSSSSITVSFTRQGSSINATGGNPVAAIQNRVVLYEDSSVSSKHDAAILWTTSSAPASVTITGLTPGKTYIAYVIAERKYTKEGLLSGSKRFEDVLIRKNYVTKSVVMSETPGVPINIQLFPSNGKITAYYDAPNDGTLLGIDKTTLRYHFYCNKDLNNFPTDIVTNVTQESVLDVSTSYEAVITQAFRTKAAATTRTNLLPLENESPYNFSMRAVGTIGGHPLTKTSYSSVYSSGKHLESVINNTITLVADSLVPSEPVNGIMSTGLIVYPDATVPLPTAVQVLAQNSKLAIQLKKDNSGVVNNLIISLSKNDGINASSEQVDMFDTYSLADATQPSGLFKLEEYLQNSNIPAAFVKYSFTKSVQAAETYYNLEFTNLINGQSYDVDIRYSKTLGTDRVYSDSVVVTRAPEAPPTTVQSPSFSVNNNSITANWLEPINRGGAGIAGNGDLKYVVSLNDSGGNLINTFQTDTLSYTISGLANGTLYKVTVAGFYKKFSDQSDVIGAAVSINSTSPNLIKPNVPPAGGGITAVSNINNAIIVTTLTAASAEQFLYPLTKIQIWVRNKAIPANTVCVYEQTAGGGFSGINSHIFNIGNFTSVSGTAPSTIIHATPLNGFNYEVVLKHVPNYAYAQIPPDKVMDATPMGALLIIGAVLKVGTNNKTLTVSANLNGSGSINNIIALAKGSLSTSILVSNLSGGTLPIIALSGALDNDKAANQLATFDLAFPGASGNVNDLLVVAVSQNSSDTFVFPTTGFFNA